jgi:hypothetical protein
MSSQEVETLLQLEVVLFKQILFGEKLVSKRKLLLLLLLQTTDDELPLMMPTAAPVPISHEFVTTIAPICAIELILTNPLLYFPNPSQTISSQIPLQFCSSLTAKLSLVPLSLFPLSSFCALFCFWGSYMDKGQGREKKKHRFNIIELSIKSPRLSCLV